MNTQAALIKSIEKSSRTIQEIASRPAFAIAVSVIAGIYLVVLLALTSRHYAISTSAKTMSMHLL